MNMDGSCDIKFKQDVAFNNIEKELAYLTKFKKNR